MASSTQLINSILQFFSAICRRIPAFSQKAHSLDQLLSPLSVMNLQHCTCLCLMTVCMFCGWQRVTVLLAVREKWNKKGYFSPLCKQLAASHAFTINGHLIGNNHFYLSKFKIGSYPWKKQLLVEPSGNIAVMFEDVVDQCLQEVVHTWTLTCTTVGTHLWKLCYPKSLNSARGFTVC